MRLPVKLSGACCALTMLLPCAGVAAEDGQAAVEAKLRESLRNTMLQLRTAEGDKVALQAAKTEAEGKITKLTAELEKLTKQSSSEKIAADKALGETRKKLTAAEEETARLRESLGKWQAGYSQLAEAAKAKENERGRLANVSAVLERKVADQRARNAALFKLANEVLSRYEKFGLGEALKAREPFTGIARAKLESLMQDYEDKIEAQRIKPEPAPVTVAGKGNKKP